MSGQNPTSITPSYLRHDRVAYKPAEAAAILGISRSRVFELLRSKELGSVRIGGTRLVPRTAIDRLLTVDEAA